MSGRVVLLIGCGVMAEPYLVAAQRLDFAIALVEVTARAIDLRERFPDLIVDVEVVDDGVRDDDGAWIAPAFELATRVAIAGVVAFAEPHVLAAALVHDHLGLPGTGMRAAITSRDKSVQRATFRARGLPQPAYRLVDSVNDVTTDERGTLPLVVKALAGTGSAGVTLVETEQEWRDLVARRPGERVLLEQYVTAPEYSWEALVHDGVAVATNLTRKSTTGPPHFVETAHEPGYGEVDPALQVAADAMGTATVQAIGMGTGVVCLEFRADGTELFIMEVMVRMPGDHLMEVVSRTHGYDWFGAVLQMSAGSAPTQPIPSAPVRAAASVYLTTSTGGTVRRLDLTRATEVDGVVRARAGVRVGDHVTATESSSERLAAIILDCPDRASLVTAVSTARTAVEVDIEPRSRIET